MNLQITLTGGWKIMNMHKLGTVLQVVKRLGNAYNPMFYKERSIHYAQQISRHKKILIFTSSFPCLPFRNPERLISWRHT
jgi:hypothetical protein